MRFVCRKRVFKIMENAAMGWGSNVLSALDLPEVITKIV
jgi:hypothetical protein